MPPRAEGPPRRLDRGRSDFARAVTAATEAGAGAGLVQGRGLTTSEVAARYRVGEDKVRAWIVSGKLAAINTADVTCAKPRYVVLPEHLAAFEKARATGPLPKPAKRRSRRTGEVDFFPGD